MRINAPAPPRAVSPAIYGILGEVSVRARSRPAPVPGHMECFAREVFDCTDVEDLVEMAADCVAMAAELTAGP